MLHLQRVVERFFRSARRDSSSSQLFETALFQFLFSLRRVPFPRSFVVVLAVASMEGPLPETETVCLRMRLFLLLHRANVRCLVFLLRILILPKIVMPYQEMCILPAVAVRALEVDNHGRWHHPYMTSTNIFGLSPPPSHCHSRANYQYHHLLRYPPPFPSNGGRHM